MKQLKIKSQFLEKKMIFKLSLIDSVSEKL